MSSSALISTGVDALLHGCAFARVDTAAWLRITGEDRVRWLNGMVTNSVQALGPGEGCYTFVLNAQGRIQGDGTAFLLDDAVMFQTSRDQAEPLAELFRRYIIMDDVELCVVSDKPEAVLVAGPEAPRVLAGVLPGWEPRPGLRLDYDPRFWLSIARKDGPLAPRWELWAEGPTLLDLERKLAQTGAISASATDLEHLRLLEGTPRFGTDIRERDLPQETALPGTQSRALHFSKGCYLGQEIVERIRSRGNLHRTLCGFTLAGELAPAGTALTLDGKPVGEITSAAEMTVAGAPVRLALGYIRREALENGRTLEYAGGTAAPCTLPYTGVAGKGSRP